MKITSFFADNPVFKKMALILAVVLQLSVIAAMFIRANAIKNDCCDVHKSKRNKK